LVSAHAVPNQVSNQTDVSD